MIKIKPYDIKYIDSALQIWNEVVEEGIAFPQEEKLNQKTGNDFFKLQSHTGLAFNDDEVVGLYILHPNNVGRCGHIANASYAVSSKFRGQHIGETLVKHSIDKARELNFKILQFNAVVASNIHARHLYKRLGFIELGIIPNGFRLNDDSYVDIIPHYLLL